MSAVLGIDVSDIEEKVQVRYVCPKCSHEEEEADTIEELAYMLEENDWEKTEIDGVNAVFCPICIQEMDEEGDCYDDRSSI